MVSFSKDEKDLKIPASLGNFQSNGGGGGVTPQEVQEMINSSITQYDETVQGYIGDVEVDVEQNKDDIETLSGLTSELGEAVVSLSGQTAQISGITAQIEALSGITSGLSNDLSSLGTDVETLSGATSGIATDLQTLSAYTESIVIPDMNDYTTTAVTAELSAVTSGIATDLQALSAYTETIPTGYTIPIASQNVLGGVKVGEGLTIDSGGTLSVSGGSDSSTVKYLTEDTWPGAYWEVGTGEMNKWGASIRRPDYTEIFETYFKTNNGVNECVVMGEGNLGNTGSKEGNLTITDAEDHIMLDKQGNRYVFKWDAENGIMYFYHSPDQTGSFYYEGAQGSQYVTGSTTGTVHIELAKVLSGNTWIQKDEILFPKTYFIDAMSDAERVELFNLIKYSGPKISPIAKYCKFFSEIDGKDGFMGMCEVYFCRFDSGTYLSFTGSVPSRNSNLLFKVKFNINPNGSVQGKTITEYDLTVHS